MGEEEIKSLEKRQQEIQEERRRLNDELSGIRSEIIELKTGHTKFEGKCYARFLEEDGGVEEWEYLRVIQSVKGFGYVRCLVLETFGNFIKTDKFIKKDLLRKDPLGDDVYEEIDEEMFKRQLFKTLESGAKCVIVVRIRNSTHKSSRRK